jgi:hypothetical protein
MSSATTLTLNDVLASLRLDFEEHVGRPVPAEGFTNALTMLAGRYSSGGPLERLNRALVDLKATYAHPKPGTYPLPKDPEALAEAMWTLRPYRLWVLLQRTASDAKAS